MCETSEKKRIFEKRDRVHSFNFQGYGILLTDFSNWVKNGSMENVAPCGNSKWSLKSIQYSPGVCNY